jgi:hypothetical protein
VGGKEGIQLSPKTGVVSASLVQVCGTVRLFGKPDRVKEDRLFEVLLSHCPTSRRVNLPRKPVRNPWLQTDKDFLNFSTAR